MKKINDTTWKKIANSNPKDLLEVIVGDEKQQDFFPQVKIQRWDNECNFSVRLKGDNAGQVNETGGKVKWVQDKIEMEFFETDDAFKFEYILKEKPTSNVLEFTIQSKDVQFDYQPELTQEEKDRGDFRPDNVIGSYAVYAIKPKINITGGKIYRVGKIGHIFRPRLIDAEGKETWGELNIENGLYTVTIPQKFLDEAIYPIKSNDTFGYNTAGSTESTYFYYNRAAGSYLNTIASGNGYVDDINLCSDSDNNANQEIKFFIVTTADDVIIANSLTPGVDMPMTKDWATYSYSTKPSVSNGVGYAPWFVSGTNVGDTYYDSGAGSNTYYETDNSFTTPTNPTSTTGASSKWSIYATYTVSGAADAQYMTTNKFW